MPPDTAYMQHMGAGAARINGGAFMALLDRKKWTAIRMRGRRMLVRINQKVPPGFRLALGLVLIAGGVLGFLPVLGFWMIPLGLGVVWLDLRAFWRLWKARRDG